MFHVKDLAPHGEWITEHGFKRMYRKNVLSTRAQALIAYKRLVYLARSERGSIVGTAADQRRETVYGHPPAWMMGAADSASAQVQDSPPRAQHSPANFRIFSSRSGSSASEEGESDSDIEVSSEGVEPVWDSPSVPVESEREESSSDGDYAGTDGALGAVPRHGGTLSAPADGTRFPPFFERQQGRQIL